MKPEETVRKLRQHDDDILSIYEILGVIQTTLTLHSTRFDGIDTRLDGIDTRLEGVEGKLDSVLDLLRQR